MSGSKRLRWLWIGWIVGFLIPEIANAADKKPGGTLSECVWRWFPAGAWRLILAAFLATLAIHFVTEGTALYLCILGALLAARIVYVEVRAWMARRSSKGA